MKTTKKTGIKVTASVKAGGFGPNHSRGALRVKTGLKAGRQLLQNHSREALRVKTGLKAGGQLLQNHSVTLLAVS